MSGPTIHSEHGASSAYRWMACPGSVSMSRGLEEYSSEFAREGTAAHALAEIAFGRNKNADFWLGDTVEGVEVTEDMAEAVQVYLDLLNELITLDDEVKVEHRISLERLNPPRPMFGTCDMLIYRRIEKKLYVIDYKHGKGVPVEAKGNKQLRYYALGALLSLADDQPCETVEAIIVQPRAPHADGPIRRETFTPGELIDFAADLIEAVELSLQDNAPLVPGSHCKFCKAAALCPAKREETMELAKSEFADVAPLDPRHLTPAQLGEILHKAEMVEDWIRSLWSYAEQELMAGRAVPGWKLVNKRPMRRWAVSEDEVVAQLKRQVDVDQLYEQPKLKSPAQVEKVLGKKNFPADLVVAVSSGLTLAPDSDKRQAASVIAADEFGALPAE